MPKIAHFEMPSDDPERLACFYRSVFNWSIHRWDGLEDYWFIARAGEREVNGGITRHLPVRANVNLVEVADVDQTVVKVLAAGGWIVRPRRPIPTVGWLAYCSDPDGNAFGIITHDLLAR